MTRIAAALAAALCAASAFGAGEAPTATADAPDTGTQSSLSQVADWLRHGMAQRAEELIERRLGDNGPDVDDLVRKARSQQLQGDLEGLESTAWALRDQRPDSPWGFLFLGRAALARGSFRPALGFFRQGLDLASPRHAALIGCFFGSFDSLFLLGEYAEALALAVRYPPRDPQDPDFTERRLLLHLARAADRGDLSPLLMTLAQDRPATPTVWLWEPFLEQTVHDLLAARRPEEAAAVAGGYGRLFPESTAAWNCRAMAEWALERYDEGFNAFRRAESLSRPGPAWGLRYLMAANVATQVEAVDLQIEFYEKALRAGAGTPLALNNLAWSYYQKGVQTELALKLVEEAVRLRPDDAPSLDTLARLQARSGQRDKALISISRAIELSLFDPYVEDMKAFRRQLLGGSLEKLKYTSTQ